MEAARSRLGLVDLVGEAASGLAQRPGRSLLTMLGTVLGIGAFVAIIGLSATANGQISHQFNLLDATQVTVTDAGTAAAAGPGDNFPAAAERLIDRLRGVVASGVWWEVGGAGQEVTTTPIVGATSDVDIYAATPGTLGAAGVTIAAGTPFNAFHEATHQDVALVGAAVAAQLGLSTVADAPAIFVDDHPLTVIGIISSATRLPQFDLGVVVPATTARSLWGDALPSDPAQMLITTRVGAAHLVASEAPVALRPDGPQLLQAVSAPNPTVLRRAVTADLNSTLLLLAAVAVVIGALGIANTTLVAILERTGEIGLRRSLGARPVHILAQFLTESVAVGFVGGLIGTALAVLVTLAVTVAHHWTAVIDPWVLVLAAPAGAAVGFVAGLYPAVKAGRIEPAEALRR